MKTKLTLLACTFLVLGLAATPVRFDTRYLTGGRLNRKITITPVVPWWTDGTNLIGGRPLELPPSAGSVTINLVPADYWVSVEGSSARLKMSVPSSTNTLLAVALMNNLPTYYYTNPPSAGGGGVPLRGERGVNVTTVSGTNVAALAAAVAVDSVQTDRLDLKRWIAARIEVSGAGDEAVNGIYMRDVAAADYTYVKAETTNYVVTLSGNTWSLQPNPNPTFVILYLRAAGSPVNGAWTQVLDGTAPAPTVSFNEFSWPMNFPNGGGVFWLSNAQPPLVGYTAPTLYWRTGNDSFQVVDTAK